MRQLLSSSKKQEVTKEMAADRALMNGIVPPPDAASLPPGHPPIGDGQAAGTAGLPPGHPPMGSMPAGKGNLPPGHPPLSGAADIPFESQHPEHMLQLNPPSTWQVKPARRFTVAVYDLPKADGDDTDAQLSVSHYPEMKKIPVQQQIDRWIGMFESPTSQSAVPAVRQFKLADTPHPTTVVEISGRYQAGSMGMIPSVPKDNQRMMAAIVETDGGPWFFKLIGPQATVAQHADEFLTFLRQAK